MKPEPISFVRPRIMICRYGTQSLARWRFAAGRPQTLVAALALAVSLAAALCAPAPLQLRGAPGRVYVIEASTDLQHWAAIATTQADAAGRVLFNDPQAGSLAQRFYRGRLGALDLLGAHYRPDRVLVKPRAGITLATVSALNATFGATSMNTFPQMGNLQIVQTPANLTASSLIALYRQSGLVQYAEPDYYVHAQLKPNDLRFQNGELWNFDNIGQFGGTTNADIDAPEAWDSITSASNVIVAVIDTGVRYTHEDLAPNMWVNGGEIPGNGVDDDNNGFVDDVHGMNTLNNSGNPDDDYGHGSHVAGIIGAVGNNQLGVVGVCWRVQIMALKFIDAAGNGSVSDAIRCIDYARSKGAGVINASWGATTFTSQALQDAIASARDADIIFSAASGNARNNNDADPLYPASYDLDNIIAVAATTLTDELASFSNFGATNVDLGAPGSPILSCWNGSDSDYEYYDGTSMAAAHVTGVAALLRAFYPNENYRQIINRILAGVDPLPALADKCTTGGRLNAQKALGTTPPTTPVITVSATDTNASEAGDPGAFTITRSGSAAVALTVNYALGGTASNGTDYQSLPGSVTIPAGSSSTTVTVTPIADSAPEDSETVVLTVSASGSYTVGSPDSASVTISDGGTPPEEPVITLSELDPDASETGPDQGIIRFHRTGDPTQPIAQVNWAFSGTAVNGTDFEPLPTSSEFPAGLSDADLTITPTDDSEAEGSETVVVTLLDGPGYRVGSPSTATVTIADNDQPPLPTVTVTTSDANAAEPSDTGTFTVNRTGSAASSLTVNYTLNGSAVNGTDYQNLSGSFTIAAGASTANVTVTPIDDTAVEGNETVVLTLSANSAYTVGSPSSATVTIGDDDQPPPLVADFTASPLLGIVPLVVEFADGSTGNPTSWDWNFGDGATSTTRSPTHIYLIPGDYTATLTVRNSAGDSRNKSVVIHASLFSLPLPGFAGGSEGGPIPTSRP